MGRAMHWEVMKAFKDGTGVGHAWKTALLGYGRYEVGTIGSDGQKRACTYTLMARWMDG